MEGCAHVVDSSKTKSEVASKEKRKVTMMMFPFHRNNYCEPNLDKTVHYYSCVYQQ